MKVCKPVIISNSIMPKIDNDDWYIDDDFTHYSDNEEIISEYKDKLKSYFEDLFIQKEDYYITKIKKLERKVIYLEDQVKYYKKYSNKSTSLLTPLEKFKLNQNLEIQSQNFNKTAPRLPSKLYNAHIDSKNLQKISKNFEYSHYPPIAPKKFKKFKRFHKKRRSTLTKSLHQFTEIKPKLEKLFHQNNSSDMSAQVVPTTFISNKNNEKFASLINWDLSSEEDLCIRRHTVVDQQYKTNLAIKADSKEEIEFDSKQFRWGDNSGVIPSEGNFGLPQVNCKCTKDETVEKIIDSFLSEAGSERSSSRNEPRGEIGNRDPCSPYWRLLTPSWQKKIIYKSLTFVPMNQEIPIYYNGVSSEWWQKWWDYVNIEFFNPIDIDAGSLDNILRNLSIYAGNEMRTGNYIKGEINFTQTGEENCSIDFENSSINQETFLDICRTDRRENELLSSWASLMYTKPGKITNANISEFNLKTNMINLKKEMQEVYDYVLINSKGWKYLESWYGCDNPVFIPVKHV